MDWLISWWPVTVIGPVVLGGLIFYALVTRRRLSPKEKQAQSDAIKELYK